jgi:hypothetical protein
LVDSNNFFSTNSLRELYSQVHRASRDVFLRLKRGVGLRSLEELRRRGKGARRHKTPSIRGISGLQPNLRLQPKSLSESQLEIANLSLVGRGLLDA